MTLNRRQVLTGASALGFSALTSGLGQFPARAADVSGYKALVCLFMLGGNDGHDTLLPYDEASYDRYAEIRAPLLDLYAAQPGGSSRSREQLLELDPLNAADFGARRFALPPQLPGIKALFDSGNASIVANVGPLIQPVDRAQYFGDQDALPKRLFSHNDQQSTWMAGQPEGAQLGWGGRFGDAAFASGASMDADFLTATTLGNELFLTGESVTPFQLSLDGAVEIAALDAFQSGSVAGDILRQHFNAMAFNRSNLFERDLASAMTSALAVNDTINAALEEAMPLSTDFPPSFLGSQLQTVAQTMNIRGSLATNRQVFFVGLGGFDTHDNQANDLPALHSEIDSAVTAFYQSLGELGLTNDVTLFTASDFGRTLSVNGDGTDHGWGSHHFVIGGAVNGGRIYGQVPPYDIDHDQDAGNGRLIPTTSVDEYASVLGRWFGLSEAELNAVFPNLGNFTSAPLTFV